MSAQSTVCKSRAMKDMRPRYESERGAWPLDESESTRIGASDDRCFCFRLEGIPHQFKVFPATKKAQSSPENKGSINRKAPVIPQSTAHGL